MTPGGPEKGIFTRIYYPSIYPVNETINKVDKLFIRGMWKITFWEGGGGLLENPLS